VQSTGEEAHHARTHGAGLLGRSHVVIGRSAAVGRGGSGPTRLATPGLGLAALASVFRRVDGLREWAAARFFWRRPGPRATSRCARSRLAVLVVSLALARLLVYACRNIETVPMAAP
jgi:hypothetical protein